MKPKKKIGIISCDGWLRLWDNYGTLFQNYALQTHLQKLNCNTFWIQTEEKITTLARAFSLVRRAFCEPKSLINALIRRLKKSNKAGKAAFTCSKDERSRIEEFNIVHPRYFGDFFNKYIPHTQSRYSEQDLLKNPPVADVYIVGSDNIWGGVSNMTFLNFGPKSARRIAYAVSAPWPKLGRDWKARAKKKIKNIDFISVREKEGVRVCEDVGRVGAKCVCDPTLLLKKEDYLQIVDTDAVGKQFSKKTILAYLINIRSLDTIPWEKLVAFSVEEAAQLKVVPLQGAELAIPEEFVFTPSPEEWLNAYESADFVVTNSFHGTVFAIIMRRPFVVVLQKGVTESANCRFFSLLERLGLENRILRSGDSLSEIAHRNIDWERVEKALDELRAYSMEFLNEALG